MSTLLSSQQKRQTKLRFDQELLFSSQNEATEEGGIIEPSKILNTEFYRWATRNLLLWIRRRSQIYLTCEATCEALTTPYGLQQSKLNLLAPLIGNKEVMEELMLLLVRPSPTHALQKQRYILSQVWTDRTVPFHLTLMNEISDFGALSFFWGPR